MSKYAGTKLATMRTAFSDKDQFSIDQASKILGLKRSSTLWVLSNLAKAGEIARTARGVYTFDQKSRMMRMPRLGERIVQAVELLRHEGVSFVLTGMDMLLPFVQHQPARIMHLVYTSVGAGTWAQVLIRTPGLTPVLSPTRSEIDKILDIIGDDSELVIVREKSSRLATGNSLASLERAFVDLYVEATREQIPFSVQEVAYIYFNMSASIVLNKAQMIRYAHERSIKKEIKQIVDVEKGDGVGSIDKHSRTFLTMLKAIGQ